MKTKPMKPVSLIEGGREEWESTEEYRNRLISIIKEVSDKYSAGLTNEKNVEKKISDQDPA
jgi:hypothetical protein